MDWFLGILLNTWTITVFTGIISSVIAHFCISLYTKRKANKVRLQKISQANNEILYAIRPLVVDSKMPTSNLLRSLINSTARKNGVSPNDLYTPEIIIENLKKEILENIFLSTQVKLKLCEDFDNQIILNENPKGSKIVSESGKENRFVALTSIFVAIMTMTVTMLGLTNESGFVFRNSIDSNNPILILYIVLFTSMLMALVLLITRRLKSLYRANTYKNQLDILGDINKEPKKGLIDYERIVKKLDEVDVLNAWKAYRNLGAYYANIQKNELSVQSYTKAIATFPSVNQDKDARGELYILRGGVMKRLGVDSFPDALSSIEKGLILVSDDHIKGDAYYNMACIYAKMNDKDKFNDIIFQKLSRLEEKEEEMVRKRVRNWLEKNAPNYISEL